ncbi:hypothetical protein BO221_22100 [Archangium sp. Cb G35]|nr:hypothetical protein BO221_22100 [Archangium sp. Cb G35]
MRSIVAFDRQYVEHLSDEDLLQLSMEMCFWLLNKDEMDWRTVLFNVQPLGVKIEQFYDHVDEVLEPEPIIAVWKGRPFITTLLISERVMNPCSVVAAHERGRVQSRFDDESGVCQAGVSQFA